VYCLERNKHPHYIPTAARFLSQDPTGQEGSGPNLYLYTADSPTNATDPYGTNLAPPTPGTPGASGGGGSSGGSSSSSSSSSSGGGFGPSTGSCNSNGTGVGTKGHGLSGGGDWVCRNTGRVEQAEEENRKGEAREEYEETREKIVEVGTACGLGGAPTALATRSIAGGPQVTTAVATFCTGYALGDLIVRPILHEIFPEIFAE